jgi:hypothetical protein
MMDVILVYSYLGMIVLASSISKCSLLNITGTIKGLPEGLLSHNLTNLRKFFPHTIFLIQ